MKCPYCGHENGEDNHCKKCFAVFPVEKPQEKPKEEPITTKRNRKEMKENGT